MENSTWPPPIKFGDYIGSTSWITVFCIIILEMFVGNLLTIFAITFSRQLSSMISNQFIFSLAISDLLVATTIPYHMCFYLLEIFARNEVTCIVRFVFISFAFASSINNLFLIAIDRYLAVVHPLRYNVSMTRRISTIMISLAWIWSFIISTVPIYWNEWHDGTYCDIIILPKGYIGCVSLPAFILIWFIMIFVYVTIWKEAKSHAKRMRNNTNQNNYPVDETKSVQVVMLTLGCFSICWMPFFIVTTYFRISGISNKSSLLYEIGFTMAVANSGMNPIIYAWKNSNFRVAFWYLLTCHSPNRNNNKNNYITNHVPSNNKKSTSTTKNGVDGICNGKEEDLIRSEFSVEIDGNESSVSTEMTSYNTLPKTKNLI